MAKLPSLKSRIKPHEGRKMTSLAEAAGSEGWGSGRGGRPWRRKRETILLRDHYTCRTCGLVTHSLEVDHIVNLAQGGTEDDSNLQALCIPCHKAKTARESVAHLGC